MTDTTSLEDLPTNPSTANTNNVVLQKTEKNVSYSPEVKVEDGPVKKMPSPRTNKKL